MESHDALGSRLPHLCSVTRIGIQRCGGRGAPVDSALFVELAGDADHVREGEELRLHGGSLTDAHLHGLCVGRELRAVLAFGHQVEVTALLGIAEHDGLRDVAAMGIHPIVAGWVGGHPAVAADW